MLPEPSEEIALPGPRPLRESRRDPFPAFPPVSEVGIGADLPPEQALGLLREAGLRIADRGELSHPPRELGLPATTLLRGPRREVTAELPDLARERLELGEIPMGGKALAPPRELPCPLDWLAQLLGPYREIDQEGGEARELPHRLAHPGSLLGPEADLRRELLQPSSVALDVLQFFAPLPDPVELVRPAVAQFGKPAAQIWIRRLAGLAVEEAHLPCEQLRLADQGLEGVGELGEPLGFLAGNAPGPPLRRGTARRTVPPGSARRGRRRSPGSAEPARGRPGSHATGLQLQQLDSGA